MKTRTTSISWKSIALFYIIALIVRAIVLRNENIDGSLLTFCFWVFAEGFGPCLGALVAVVIFKRKFYCSITGKSVVKSILTMALPLVICFFLNRSLSLSMLGFILYSLLEEVGWRGYLQGELKDISHPLRVFIISTMWFFWHIAVGFNWGSLIFYGVLVLGSWGIGNIARDTRSLIACACFHALFNFSNLSKQGSFQFTPLVIALYVGVFISWILIWRIQWKETFLRLSRQWREKRNKTIHL